MTSRSVTSQVHPGFVVWLLITLGLAYFAINVAMLALAEWIAPHFTIDGFWTYVGATIVVWLVNVAMQAVLGGLSGRRARQITG